MSQGGSDCQLQERGCNKQESHMCFIACHVWGPYFLSLVLAGQWQLRSFIRHETFMKCLL